ncbi:hypothetical protein EV426DRAFT_532390 [Tirmania nivea]|nr:hypothetical protein EV426DRAFT_532390 [Tirmania nivea]
MDDEAELELAQFRSQWQQEVTQKARQQQQQQFSSTAVPVAGPSQRLPSQAPPPQFTYTTRKSSVSHASQEGVSGDERGPSAAALPIPGHTFTDPHLGSPPLAPLPDKGPKSAMEHFEKAIEREGQGNLGDSLYLYRKAYRMDPKIDAKYRQKYFPRAPIVSTSSTSSNIQSPLTSPNTAHHSCHAPSRSASATPAIPTKPVTTTSLIASFSNLRIQANPLATFTPLKSQEQPESTTSTTNSEEPEEPARGFSLLANLPHELLLHTLRFLAYTDITSFARCSLVCKSLAYTISTEDSIWKEACHHPHWGFPSQVWDFQCNILGEALPDLSDLPMPKRPSSPTPIKSLLPNYKNSYKHMFHSRPRIRYNGLYISTCNYIRPGAFHSSSTTVTGATPVHIVTYYRYLRFYPDGTCLSLLTTHEPPDVVYHLSKPSPPHTQPTTQGYLSTLHPWGKHVLRGRWRLDTRDSGDVDIETESASGEKFLFKMGLCVKNVDGDKGGRSGARLNKLVWRGFWSWNRLTNNVAEFSLRNDKPFFWSRVRRFDRELLWEV